MTLKVQNLQAKANFSSLEHDVLTYWDNENVFQKSITSRSAKRRYVFYDGPPFATGLPHYGHILASTIKDVIPRYWTMKGYKVDRVWGWDCHGIPIENMIEKELGLKGGKKGIEELGIDKFNASCRAAILRYDKEWEKVIRRIGRWVDFKNSYKTMDKSYMESVWWAFKTMYDKGYVYEGRKVILYCPRCATPLSNFEIAMDNSYKDVEDNSVYVKFKVVDSKNEYLLAWTTTPWTLIGNVALAVDTKATYAQVKVGDDLVWLGKDLLASVFQDKPYSVIQTKLGNQLVGVCYEPLYEYMPLDNKKAHYVVGADFVSLTDGTGIVHTAAIFGEDDYKLAVNMDLPRVPTLDDEGKFLSFVTPLHGVFYKKSEQWIIDDLVARSLMFRAEKTKHSYPFCYRCETPLYYNAVPAWFIDVQKMKDTLVSHNENISWYPNHLKYGRFGKGLQTAPDWNISRSRYWGTPMPIWQEVGGKAIRIIGSIEELKKWSVHPEQVSTISDIHREFIDDIEVWIDDNKTRKGKRIPEVFDCWVESGSMPYASIHYPFENKDIFENTHPAQFIAEYIAQTRAWFYTLHVMSVGLFDKHTFENAVTTGTILAEDGTKMSKSKKNYPDPSLIFEKYGVDALRFYLMSSVVMKGDNLNFSEKSVQEMYQRVISLVWNTFSFFKLYNGSSTELPENIVNVLDRWMVSKTNRLIRDVTVSMDSYDTSLTCRYIVEFIDDLSTWYLRRSRERLKNEASSMRVFGWVLEQLIIVMAPITPFITELIYQNIKTSESDISIHLLDWPKSDESALDNQLETQMVVVREVVEIVHSLRKQTGIPVKQALGKWAVTNTKETIAIDTEMSSIINEETNVKKRVTIDIQSFASSKTVVSQEFVSKIIGPCTVYLDTLITEELVNERRLRELIRAVQSLRKESQCTVSEHIHLVLPEEYKTLPKTLLEVAMITTLVDKIIWGESLHISTLQS